MKGKILVVDDEKSIAEIIEYNLDREGYEVTLAYDGQECLDVFKNKNFDLIILDIMMPKLDGFSALKEIRKSSSVPVIMLTAKQEEVDKILGLELGADDYVVKPFSMRELIARVKAILRRNGLESEGSKSNILEVGDLKIDMDKYEIKKKNKEINLTLREYELMKYLIEKAGQVVSREELLDKVWDYEYYGDIRTVDVTIRRLREKIEDKGKDYKYILTKRGVGYYFGG
ncbi:Transcriptional regulatory protein WalR [Peptoniphilus sp. ING2-D1G]|nr:Transcriptional regulatory protein WalR [Peptoniphilus sp. ING2-D1G]